MELNTPEMKPPDSERQLVMYTIYERPRDFPTLYVVRRYYIVPGQVILDPEPWAITRTLAEARERVPRGADNLGRKLDDEPPIVETWCNVE